MRFKLFIGLVISLAVSRYAGAQGFLKAQGKLIVNDKGQKVILRGMGLGGDMLQEGYMFKVAMLNQQYKIRAGIEDLVGPEKTAEFYNTWLANNTRKIDVDSMARWGFNSIRLPMHFNLYTLPVADEPVAGKNTWLKKGFEMTDSLLKWCKANHMYLILDLHATPGGQGNDLPIADRHPDQPTLWESRANQEKMIALWAKLAERYKDEPNIGGYDIINEPNMGFDDPKDVRGTNEKTNAPLKKLMMEITAAIRTVDKKHIVIIEGNGFGNNYNGVLPAWDNNMVLSFHKYGNFNTEKQIANFMSLRDKYNVPLWLGESGENSNTWYTECIGMVERNDIGWSWWPLKKMGGNNPLEIKVPDGYQKLLDYWSKKGPKPSAAEAQVVLDQWLQNLKLENNIIHRDVIDAMFRQVRTADTKPYKANIITNNTTILAADYDLGRQRSAYYDTDTASYHYTPGVNTAGNRGYAYRNDGVDIRSDKDGPYISNIEDGEWLQYTLHVKAKGVYTLRLAVSSNVADGKLSIKNGDKALGENLVPNTGGTQNWQTLELKGISLNAGTNKLRVYADKGGWLFRNMEFVK
ncbi:cellulase family glycosylhydrolase [Mucilaginibacter mali]|uniref:Cellulase family glycosylhydrolase n=1 Tax=Mucilaginibacter mali TaxID=2740462 RepID=A0A7D4UCQ9_9SPHI|nr:cellulase family glycosylhydrolase [Mucilaginibacter mali]QKJ31938.1 cellulase family glycosylhydrolase [Mucilaginibacter mali]